MASSELSNAWRSVTAVLKVGSGGDSMSAAMVVNDIYPWELDMNGISIGNKH